MYNGVGELSVDPEFEHIWQTASRSCLPFIMESQTFEQPPQTALQPSRPQSNDVNAMSRTSRAERPPQSPFLLITFFLGFVSISLFFSLK